MRIGMIGYGAIGSHVHDLLIKAGGPEIVAALVSSNAAAALDGKARGLKVVADWESFAAMKLDVIVEAAGHSALRQFGIKSLKSAPILIVASVGALADADLEQSLRNAALASSARIVIPSGAAGGLDALTAARRSQSIESVRYMGRKHPDAWRGTAAEGRIDLEKLAAPTCFFEGTAREAALTFPQNANVVAAIALAGIGFDATTVSLFADPQAEGNSHTIDAQGAFGTIKASVTTAVLANNPKTSILAPCSLAHTILRLSDPVYM